MNNEMETCKICFEDYRIENTKDHQCPDIWSCGACGEICDAEDGTISTNNGLIEFTHTAKLCGAQDEIAEKILSCDDCDSQITVELSAYGNGKMATIICPKCGISYDTDLDPTDINELEKENN